MHTHFLTFCLLFMILICGANSRAQPSIVVRGTYAQEEILAQAFFYAEALGLDQHVHIIISFTQNISTDKLGFTQYQDARGWNDGGHQIYIRINKHKGRSHQLMTLAHEMVHAQQFVLGKLVHCHDDQYSWQSNLCTDLSHMPYHQRPWEQEAHAEAIKLYEAYKNHSLMAIGRTKQNAL